MQKGERSAHQTHTHANTNMHATIARGSIIVVAAVAVRNAAVAAAVDGLNATDADCCVCWLDAL